MKNINELLKEYEKDCDLLYRVEDYTHAPEMYICDTISEIADSETDIYYSGLINWLKNDPDSVDAIEEAAAEFGRPEKFDFIRFLQQGQYYQNEQKLYNNIDTVAKIWLLAYLRNKENLSEITDEQADYIDDFTANNNDQFEKLLDDYKEQFNA